ncbi:uncharacterized protein LOC127708784 [Mytilus californianus]|uniref:uncharacterized protein LOC127708784 n=1 Tax=Mytilus californianus TaxID=6549 RepID=UPI002246089F|nr:uncharacterized protein LOC127708784 [Mytilus californianus]
MHGLFLFQIWISFILTKFVYMERNLTAILCEQQTVSLKCDEGTRIHISEVHFGQKEEVLSLANTTPTKDENTTREIVELLCNTHNTCRIDNSLNNFTGFLSLVPRKISFTYRCEFEYHGCFTDEMEYGLYSRGFFLADNMSAKICYYICNTGHVSRQFFATENGDQCFCGGTIGLSKLEKRKQKENKCETPCVSNENEMCGSINKASVYVFETDKQQIDSAYTTQMNLHSCHYGSEMKDIYIKSLERSEHCDDLANTTLSDTQNCYRKFYCFNSSIDIRNITEDFRFLFLRKYMKITYSCLGDSNAPVGSLQSINGSIGSHNNNIMNSVPVGSLHSINASIVGGVVGAVILTVCIVFLTLCLVKRSTSKNRKKKRRQYTTSKNGSEIQDNALLVMLSSNNPSSPGYESLQLNHTEFFEYAQTMVTAEQDLTDDEIINDHCSKQLANDNNEVNHYEFVEAANYSKYDKGCPCNQSSFQFLNSSESVSNNSQFNSNNKIEELLPVKNIICDTTIDNPYDTIDPEETGFNRSKSNNSNSKLEKIVHGEYPTQRKSTGNAYAVLDPKETGFYRSSSCNSNSKLENIVHCEDPTQRESTGNAYAILDPIETGFYRNHSLDNELVKVFPGDDLNQKDNSTVNPYAILNPEETGYSRSKVENCKRACSETTRIDPPGLAFDNRMEDYTQNAYSVLDSGETGFIRGQVTVQMNETCHTNNEYDLNSWTYLAK